MPVIPFVVESALPPASRTGRDRSVEISRRSRDTLPASSPVAADERKVATGPNSPVLGKIRAQMRARNCAFDVNITIDNIQLVQ